MSLSDRTYPHPQSSFPHPVPIPVSAPDDSPLLCVAVNAEWMRYVIGSLKQLVLPSTWGYMGDPGVLAAQAAANDLLAIFCDAPVCAVGSVSGTYAGNCLTANVALAVGTATAVLSIDVVPGDYILTARLGLEAVGGATQIAAWITDGTTILATNETTPGSGGWDGPMTLTTTVNPTADTTYTLYAVTTYQTASVQADNHNYPLSTHVTTCLEAIPLGAQGDTGATGPAGTSPEIRFTAGCGLETSIDGGTTWVAVPGWLTNAATCFAGFNGAGIPESAIDPGAPPNPQDATTDQQACNIAAYIASDVLAAAINQGVSNVRDGKNALELFLGVALIIPGFGEALDVGALIAAGIFTALSGGTLSDYSDATADPAFLASITCAIYDAIKADGRVTDSNYAGILTAVGGIVTTHTAALSLVVSVLTSLGARGLEKLQIPGALTVGDCSACDQYCRVWDFTIDAQAWTPIGGDSTNGAWSSAGGGAWYSFIGGGVATLAFETTTDSSSATVNSVTVKGDIAGSTTNQAKRAVVYNASGDYVDLPLGPFSEATVSLAGLTVTRLALNIQNDGESVGNNVTQVSLSGPGTPPAWNGSSACS